MGTNAAVQGCSMSIIMANSMYAILSAHLKRLYYCRVSSACFIGDVKIWAKGLYSPDLEKAFNEFVAYDTAVGQKVNFDKTFLAFNTVQPLRTGNRMDDPCQVMLITRQTR